MPMIASTAKTSASERCAAARGPVSFKPTRYPPASSLACFGARARRKAFAAPSYRPPSTPAPPSRWCSSPPGTPAFPVPELMPIADTCSIERRSEGWYLPSAPDALAAQEGAQAPARAPPGRGCENSGARTRASRPQRAEGPRIDQAGGTPVSVQDTLSRRGRGTPFPRHASLGEAPSRQPQALYGQGPGCAKSPRIRRVAGGTPAFPGDTPLPEDAPLPGPAEPEPAVRS